MIGRFTAKRAAAPELVPVAEPVPALEGMTWTVFPEPATEPVLSTAGPSTLLTEKLEEMVESGELQPYTGATLA